MEVSRFEIYRYLGMGKQEPDERTKELVESCVLELQKNSSPRVFYRNFPLRFLPDGTMDFSCFMVRSRDLAKNLRGCREIILFAATLGAGADYLIRRYSRIQVSRAAVMQAAAAAMIEAVCDEANESLRAEMAERGMGLRPRYSPGYGDFPLEYQRELCRTLAAEKTVGITLTEGCLMFPSKSVTAVIGVVREEDCKDVGGADGNGAAVTLCKEPEGRKEGCAACGKRDCLYRR